MYSPPVEQPDYNLAPEELNEAQKEVHDFFCNKNNIDKLVYYFSMEDKKGKDKFSTYRFLMFKVGIYYTYMSLYIMIIIFNYFFISRVSS